MSDGLSATTATTHIIVYDIDRCLYHLRRCVRLSPDGTVKPEGEIKMTHEEFSQWVRNTRRLQDWEK